MDMENLHLLADLLTAIDLRWAGETTRKIQNAISPRMAEAIVAGHEALGNVEGADFWRSFIQH